MIRSVGASIRRRCAPVGAGGRSLRKQGAISGRVVMAVAGLGWGIRAVAGPASGSPSIIDLAAAPARGVRDLRGFTGVPSHGVLRSWQLALPAYVQGCYFSTFRGKWPDLANNIQPWMFGRDIGGLLKRPRPDYLRGRTVSRRPSPYGVFALFRLATGEVLAVLPMTGRATTSWLEVDDEGRVRLMLGTFGTDPVRTEAPLVAWARSVDAATAVRNAWAEALAGRGIDRSTVWRYQKTYPEPFRYLGWCSWEQYRKSINSKILVRAAAGLERSGLPVRWVLVDDGYQQNGKPGSDNRPNLASFEPDRTKFPEGWRPLMALRRPDKIRWIGLWYAFLGLWGNVAPKNQLGRALNARLVRAANGGLVPADDPDAAAAFYDALIGSVKRDGFDFVKVDGQTRAFTMYAGRGNAVHALVGDSRALENAVHTDLQGMINCSAQMSVEVFNTRYSAVTRCSRDYHYGQAAAARANLMQSYANTLWLGQTVWPDHDMFHSSDPVCGRMLAVSKALSGGPVYLSDAPKDLVAANIRPLCYLDGRLLRPLAPAVPLPDSVFTDALNTPNAYRVVAPLANGAAAVALYNLCAGAKPTAVRATVTDRDYRQASAMIQPWPGNWSVPSEGLVLYDWYAGRGTRLAGSWSTTLKGLSDRLVLLTPIHHGWSVIGRADKFLAPAAVSNIRATSDTLSFTLKEAGPVVVYSSEDAPLRCDSARFRPIGGGLWRADLPVAAGAVTLTLHR